MAAFPQPPLAPEDIAPGQALRLNEAGDGWEAFTPAPSAAIAMGLGVVGFSAVERTAYMPSDGAASFADVLQSGPWTIAASSQAVIPSVVFGEDPYPLTVDANEYGLSATLIVSNVDGSELIEVDASGLLASTGQAVINFGTTGIVGRSVGSDLTWGGSGNAKVASAAGGTYTAVLKVLAEPEG